MRKRTLVLDSITHNLIQRKDCCPTAGVTRWWVGGDNAILSERTPSHSNCLKTRRVPPVGCTLCWATTSLPEPWLLKSYKTYRTDLRPSNRLKMRTSTFRICNLLVVQPCDDNFSVCFILKLEPILLNPVPVNCVFKPVKCSRAATDLI